VPGELPAVMRGHGMWIWQLPKSEGGDVNAIAARARGAGVRTVFVKSADGTTPWAQFNATLVQALHELGGQPRQGAGCDVPDAWHEMMDGDGRNPACRENSAGFPPLPEAHDQHDEDSRKGEVETDDGGIAEKGAEQRTCKR